MYTQTDVKKVQERLLEMAVVIRDILESHKIPYFITYGTLLGAVRHNGFIPWDDDFDFYLFDDSYDDGMSVLRSDLPSDMFLEDSQSEPLYFHSWAHVKDLFSKTECDLFPHDGKYVHQGLSVDLYRIKKMPLSEVDTYRIEENLAYLKRRMEKGLIDHEDFQQKYGLLLEKKEQLVPIADNQMVFATVLPILEKIEYDAILPLKRYSFEGYDFYGPNNADSFLSQRYGSYMQLPPLEDRKPHYSSVQFLNIKQK